MEWYQFLMLEISLVALIGGIYRINQNTIKEWRDEHRHQIDKIEERINKMDEKWERLFEKWFSKKNP